MLMNAQSNVRSFPLNMATVGESVCVVSVDGGKNLLQRLLAMGITDGTELEIMQHQPGSGIVVRCANTRWALGTDMAHKILVSSIADNR